jgi:hypothetical protein
LRRESGYGAVAALVLQRRLERLHDAEIEQEAVAREFRGY